MTDSETIAMALAAVATAGTSAFASTAAQDAYTTLRNGAARALSVFSSDKHDPSTGTQELASALEAAGAGHDEDLVRAARQVLALLDAGSERGVRIGEAKGLQIGDGNSQVNHFN